MRALLIPVLLLAGCAPHPEAYLIPAQHRDASDGSVVRYAEIVHVTQKNADAYFIQDIKGSEGAPWRWTLEAPEVRLLIGDADKRKLRIDLAVNETTFRDTGPLRIAIYVNDQLLDNVTYDSPGDKIFDKPVPPAMLRAGAENRVRMQVMNPWQAPDQGVRLGFLLRSVGIIAQ